MVTWNGGARGTVAVIALVVVACSGRVTIDDVSSHAMNDVGHQAGSAGAAASSTSSANVGAPPNGPPTNAPPLDAGRAPPDASTSGEADAGSIAWDAGTAPPDASANAEIDAGSIAWEAGDEGWDASGAVADAGDETPEPSACGVCPANDVCNPGIGCESACDVSTGLDPNAAWPVGGGCATRRGLSRFSGVKSANLAWSRPLGTSNFQALYSSTLTLGADDAIYAPLQIGDMVGFAKLRGDASIEHASANWLNEVPILASGGVLYTMPRGLLASRDDGHVLWNAVPPSYDNGEPVVGADGTIYAPGATGSVASLYAVTPAGALAWQVDGSNFALDTWPAVAGDGVIYFGDLEANRGRLIAVSRAGHTLWKADVGEYVFAFPSIDHNGNVYLGNGPELWSFAESGAVRFHFTDPSPNRLVFSHLAIGPDGTVYATWYESSGLGPNSGVKAFSSAGQLQWTFALPGSNVSPPVVDRDGTLFFSVNGQIVALNPDGSELWTYAAPADECGSPVIGATGATYVLCDGTLEAFH